MLGLFAPLWSVRTRGVTIARTSPLRFIGRGFGGPLQWAAALGFWAAAALIAAALVVPGAPMVIGVYGEPVSAIVFTVLGLLIAVVAAVKGLESPGIKFDEHGVWVQWHFAMRLLEWGEIERVNALAEGNM